MARFVPLQSDLSPLTSFALAKAPPFLVQLDFTHDRLLHLPQDQRDIEWVQRGAARHRTSADFPPQDGGASGGDAGGVCHLLPFSVVLLVLPLARAWRSNLFSR